MPLKKIKPGQVYVDQEHETVLVPVKPNVFAPFHISTIKNVSTQATGNFTYLRLNFYVPGGSQLNFPPATGENQIYMKELTLKNTTANSKHLTEAYKRIQELIKAAKSREQEEKSGVAEVLVSQEELELIKGKRDALDHMVIRPNIVGKRTLGALDLHQNGLRYSSTKGHKIDITFKNIKHAFFQPCGSNEMLVILHFNLKSPIMIGNKKVYDVQFVREAGTSADDIDMRGGRKRMNELDEFEQEERERKMRKSLDSKFSAFVKKIEGQASQAKIDMEFDIPIEDLFFYGAPMRASVKIKPTKNCLVALSEFPCFVLDVSEIEIVHFERIHFNLKNFDMVIIHKDYTNFKRVFSIPIEHLEDIKNYLTSIDVIFSQSVMALNWKSVLDDIRGDFQKFINDGGWRQMVDDEDEDGAEEGEGSIEEDSNFSGDDDDDAEESEDDYSEEDSDADSDSEASSLDESGLSWDELDRRAQ